MTGRTRETESTLTIDGGDEVFVIEFGADAAVNNLRTHRRDR